MVSIHKRTLDSGDARWDVRWLEAGRHRRKTFRTKKQADAFDRSTADRLARGAFAGSEPSEMTIGDWLRYWWDRDAHTFSENTRVTYDSLLRLWVIPVLDQVRLRDFGVQQAREFSSTIMQQGVIRSDKKVHKAKPVTHNRACAVLSSGLGKAVEEDLIPWNPMSRVKKIEEMSARPRVLYPAEIEAMRASMQSLRDICIMTVMAYAGLRTQEVFALTRESIGKNTIVVDQALDRYGAIKVLKPGESQRRTVDLIGPLADDLAAFMEKTEGSPRDLLFTDGDGSLDRRSWTRWAWHESRKAAKVAHATPYDCRHAYASLEINAGTPIPTVSRRLGHASITTTLKHYTHLVDDSKASPNVPVEDAVRAARVDRVGVPAIVRRRQWAT